jgi:hypothetical protein
MLVARRSEVEHFRRKERIKTPDDDWRKSYVDVEER